jgi:ribonuclease HII
VVAASVVLPPDHHSLLSDLAAVRDSKLLTPRRREECLAAIGRHAVCWGIGAVPSCEIDHLGIVLATQRAMALAIEALPLPADYLLIDHLRLPELPLPQYSLSKGDLHVLSIAAASIIAKVNRDHMMAELDLRWPGYGFARHKGYGTAQHQEALLAIGPCEEHRRSFAPLGPWGPRPRT